ncbi:MAG TPA: ABC transporter substrate-binding protein [Hyphomicrobiales bacterium]|nr:ABC transporter substrate-binding protein [Hyphomicrobiales bacterium]
MKAVLWAGLILFALDAPAGAADTTGVTRNSIKIGLFGPLTSPAGSLAKSVYAVASIYRDANDHGGINGRKIELIIEDDGCDPQMSIAAVKKLVEKDKVFLLHGGWCSHAVLAAKPYILNHPKIPYINMASASPAISEPVAPNIFQPPATSKTNAETIVNFALTKPGAKRIATVTQPDEGPSSKIREALAKLKELNITPIANIVLEKGVTDSSAQVRELKEKAPDVILVSLYQGEIATFLRDAYKEGLNTTIVATDSASIEETDKRVGIPEAMRDVYFFYPYSDTLGSPKLLQIGRIMGKYYPEQAHDMVGLQGVPGAIVMVEVLRRAGRRLTRERVLQELEKVRDFDTGVASSPITFTPKNHSGLKSANIITLVGQRLVIVSRYLGQKKPEKEKATQ